MRIAIHLVLISSVLWLSLNTAQADNCSLLTKEINQAKSNKELAINTRKLKLSEQQLKACQASIKSNQQAQAIIARDKQTLAKKSRTHFLQVSQAVKKPVELTINRRALQLRKDAQTRLATLQNASRTAERLGGIKQLPNSGANTTGAPSITRITPSTLTPGTDIVIEGAHFGTTAGTIKLKLQGKSFTAVINSWSDTWVNAYLDDAIGGVQPSDNAVINLVRPQGGSVDRNTAFLPLYVQESASEEYDSPGSIIFPGSGSVTVFSGKHLNAGWKVTHFSVANEGDYGQCNLGTPSMSIGNTRVESQLKWSYEWFQGFAWCYVDVYAEGPQGIASGL